MKNRIKRLTALILAMAMCLSLLSVNVWAADVEPQKEASIAAQSSEEAAPEETSATEEEDSSAEESVPDETESAPEAGSDESPSVEEEGAPEAEVGEHAEEEKPAEEAKEEQSLSEEKESKEKAPVDSEKTEEQTVLTAQSSQDVYAKLVSLQSRFPAGKYYDHRVDQAGYDAFVKKDERYQDSVTDHQCNHNANSVGNYDCNYFDGGSQCWGFASKLFYEVFGIRASSMPALYDKNISIGDWIRLSSEHSGIVLSINGNSFTMAEANIDYKGKIGWGSITYSKDRISYYKHASNYDSIRFREYDSKPKYATVTLSQRTYQVGESVEFVMSSDTATCYTIGIDDANGNRIDTHDTGTKESTYIRSFSTPGKYSCYITAYNDLGLTDSERIYFVVYNSKPKVATVTLSQRAYQVGESMEFVMSSDTATCYTIGIDDAKGNRIDTHDTGTKQSNYIRSFATPGQYSCYITAYNNLGLIDSERIYFIVYDSKPKSTTVTLNQRTYQVGESVKFVMSSDTATCYTIGIDDAKGNRIDTHDTGTKQSNYIRSFATPGQYSCYITAYNNLGLIDSERIYFTVYDTKPKTAAVTLAKTTYQVGESVDFVMSSDTATCYTIGIDDANGNRIDTHDTGTKESNYIRSFTTPGQYSCYITAYNNLGLLDSERIYFNVKAESESVCKTHTWDKGIVTTPATCVSQGTKTYTCTVCSETKVEEIPIDKKNHTGGEEIRNREEATCGEPGYSGDTYCKGCGKKLSSGKTIRAFGNHSWNSGVVTKQPTYSNKGTRTYTCTVCGETKSESIPKLDQPSSDEPMTNPDPEPTPTPAPQTKLTATKLSKVTVKKNVATVTWKKNTTGKGYQLQYSTDKKFKKSVKTVKISKNKTVKATVKKLKTGTWYFRIRTVSGKKTSGWSKVKSVKVK